MRQQHFQTPSLLFEKPFLPRFLLDHTTQIFFTPQLGVLSLLSTNNALSFLLNLPSPLLATFLVTWRPILAKDCQVYSLSSHVQVIINITLFSSSCVYCHSSKFIFNAIFRHEGSGCAAAVSVTRSEGFYVALSAYRTIPPILSSLIQHVQAVTSTAWRERGLVCCFVWASWRSLATDVVQLSLNGNNF